MTRSARILCLGGSPWQCDFIDAARREGHWVLVTDVSPACPGRSHADAYVCWNTDDGPGLLAVAKGHQIDLVIGEQTDRVVPVAAYLNQALDLPGIQPDTALRFTNKLAQRMSLIHSGVPLPAFRQIGSLNEARLFLETQQGAVVVKPEASQSSQGVARVERPEDLEAAIQKVLPFAPNGTFLIEEFIEGTEITVEGLVLGGRYRTLAISEKEHYAFDRCVARRLAYPPRFPETLLERIRVVAEQVVTCLGLQDGLTHAEYRIRNGVPFLVEVAARGGGNRIASKIVPHVSGVDTYALLLDSLLGRTTDFPTLTSFAACLEFLDFPPGRVRRIDGVDQILSSGLADELKLSFKVSEIICQPTDDRNRLGYMIILGTDRDDVDRRCAQVREGIQVEIEAIT